MVGGWGLERTPTVRAGYRTGDFASFLSPLGQAGLRVEYRLESCCEHATPCLNCPAEPLDFPSTGLLGAEGLWI